MISSHCICRIEPENKFWRFTSLCKIGDSLIILNDIEICEDFKGMFLSENTDVIVITSNRQTFSSLKLNFWILVIENYLKIEDVLKFESLEACKGKKATFGRLG